MAYELLMSLNFLQPVHQMQTAYSKVLKVIDEQGAVRWNKSVKIVSTSIRFQLGNPLFGKSVHLSEEPNNELRNFVIGCSWK